MQPLYPTVETKHRKLIAPLSQRPFSILWSQHSLLQSLIQQTGMACTAEGKCSEGHLVGAVELI